MDDMNDINNEIVESIKLFQKQIVYNSFCLRANIGGNKCNENNENDENENGIQQFIDSFTPYFINNQIINASNIIKPILNKLNNKLLSRISILNNMSQIVENKCSINNYINSESLPQSIEYLYFGGNNNHHSILPNDMKYNKLYHTNISLTESTVLFSDFVSFDFTQNSDINDNNILYDIKMSHILNDIMMESYPISGNEYSFTYFTSINGVTRIFPGIENIKLSENKYKEFEPRLRPWFISKESGEADFIILLDISGSMRENNRLELFKAAIISFLEGLEPNNFINIIAFNTEILIACNNDYFENELIRATKENILYLIKWINNLEPSGDTNFELAFENAYNLLNRHYAKYDTICHSTIIFLTDGHKHIQNEDQHIINIINIISNHFKDKFITTIFSYSLSNNPDSLIPPKVAQITNGQHINFKDGDINSLLIAIHSWYLFYINMDHHNSKREEFVYISSPYFDYLNDNKPVITLSKDIFINDIFVGIASNDITFSFIYDLINDFNANIGYHHNSYWFIINQYGQIVIHSDYLNIHHQFRYISIQSVEPLEFTTSGICQNMLNGDKGYKLIDHDNDTNLLYIYTPIIDFYDDISLLSFALVIEINENEIEPPWILYGGLSSDFINGDIDECIIDTNVSNTDYIGDCVSSFAVYHEMDLDISCNNHYMIDTFYHEEIWGSLELPQILRFYQNKTISWKYPSYFLDSSLWKDSSLFLETDPNCEQLDALHYVTNPHELNSYQQTLRIETLPFNGFRQNEDNIIYTIRILTSLHKFWEHNFYQFIDINISSPQIVSIWFTQYQGIHICYPAQIFNHSEFSPLTQWNYIQSVENKDLFIFSTPNKHTTTDHLVITGSTAIFAPNSSDIYGVIGFDIEFNEFIDFMDLNSNLGNLCNDDNNDCYLINSDAFIIYHNFIKYEINDDDISYKFLGNLEPTLMQSLIDNQFIISDKILNDMNEIIKVSYHVNDDMIIDNDNKWSSFSQNYGKYTVKKIIDTNLYLIFIIDYKVINYRMICPDNLYCPDVINPGCLLNDEYDDDNNPYCIPLKSSQCINYLNNNNDYNGYNIDYNIIFETYEICNIQSHNISNLNQNLLCTLLQGNKSYNLCANNLLSIQNCSYQYDDNNINNISPSPPISGDNGDNNNNQGFLNDYMQIIVICVGIIFGLLIIICIVYNKCIQKRNCCKLRRYRPMYHEDMDEFE